MKRRTIRQIVAVVALTVPWLGVWMAVTVLPALTDTLGVGYTPPGALANLSNGVTVLVSGLAVLGASFLLAWGAETAEEDVPRAFAIAVLAVLAVAPEYAVDALYAWNAGSGGATSEACASLSPAAIDAGKTPLAQACHDANLAVANMTGANRILIGIGWAGIALFTVYRARVAPDPAVENRDGVLADVVTLDHDIGLEIVFLFLATLWAFLVPLNGGIDVLDMVMLVGLYVAYIVIVLRGDVDHEEEHVGVPADLQTLPKRYRAVAVLSLFAYSGLMIFTAVEPFAHGLEVLGQDIGVPSFFMIQWVAPLASESPELIVVAYLVNKARSTAGFNALISSKLNQWTLLIGTLVLVYSISLGTYGALPFDQKQSAEIWITAAQSIFALSILVNFEISVREAIGLLVLFLSQVVIEYLLLQGIVELPVTSYDVLIGYSVVYVVLSVVLFTLRRQALGNILRDTWRTVSDALSRGEAEPVGSADD